MENTTPKVLDKTPLEQLMEYLDPIHSGIRLIAEELLIEEKKHFISFGQAMYKRGMLDTQIGEYRKKASETLFENQYKNKTNERI